MAHDITRQTCRGFTLVEVLIALVVLAIGMLGIAAMLLNGLQSSRMALLRTQAVVLAADMGDRIRANRTGSAAYALTSGTTLSAPAKSCTTAGQCNSGEVATVDLYAWQQSVQRVLPGATTSITVAPVGVLSANRYTITITWTQSGDSGAANLSLTVQA